MERRGEHVKQATHIHPSSPISRSDGVRPDWQDDEIKKLQPNLPLWSEKYPLEEYPIITPKRFPQMRQALRDKFNLGHDVPRHTYISMLVGAFRSVGDASLEAGNWEAVIRRHYLDLKTTTEADGFRRICPAGFGLAAHSLSIASLRLLPIVWSLQLDGDLA